jgi:glycosyltransferase involved in cell wall biosynthesis
LTKVAFWFDAPIEYSGGLNYIKNLLYALSLVNDGSVKPYVFFPSNILDSVEAEFAVYATVVRTDLLTRGTVPWFIHRVCYKFLGTMTRATALLRAHGISVVSHVWFVYKGKSPFRIISWIPDFQYLHLPELFPQLDPDQETKRNRDIIAQSDMNVLSSYCALEDFKQIAPPECVDRSAVLQFVSQPRQASRGNEITLEAVQKKFDFAGPFFFLPNQFWAHKNHMVVMQAVKLLKDQGIDVALLCTGTLVDFRYKDTPYVDSIKNYIAAHGLQENVRILGLIDYDEVLFLMRNAIAVLNPSRFEGWSSSVEEAKSIGKKIILSRINVHVEQAPAHGEYFDPDDSQALAAIMASVWNAGPGSADAERVARENLHQRTVAYGKAYLDVLQKVIQLPSH